MIFKEEKNKDEERQDQQYSGEVRRKKETAMQTEVTVKIAQSKE
jgi:hypothetical protein